MAQAVKLTLVGDKELIRKLKRLAKKDAKAIIRKATRQAAKIIAPRAKELAPKGPKSKDHSPGQLRRAIKVRSMKRSRSRIGAVVSMGDKSFAGDTYYGSFQNWGAKKANIPAIEFLDRAAKQKGKQAGKKARDIIRRELEARAKLG